MEHGLEKLWSEQSTALGNAGHEAECHSLIFKVFTGCGSGHPAMLTADQSHKAYPELPCAS